MKSIRTAAIGFAALFCLAVAAPVFAQDGVDKATADINAAQTTLKEMKQLGADIAARHQSQLTEAASVPVAAPQVKPMDTAVKANTGAKKVKKAAGTTTPAKKKKKTP